MGMNAYQMADEQNKSEITNPATTGAITINVNGETVDMIANSDVVTASMDMPIEQEPQSITNSFDALFDDMNMSPTAPTTSDLSPEVPSLFSFEEDLSTNSPSSDPSSPNMVASDFSFDLDFTLDGTKHTDAGFQEPLFAPCDDSVNFDSTFCLSDLITS